MANQLTPGERRALKARAHTLAPVVLIGDGGLTTEVLSEIDRSLTAHALIKIRVGGGDRDARTDTLRRLCDDLGAIAVQHIGKILVLYRDKPTQVKPKGRPRRKPARPLKRHFQNRA